MTMVRAGSAAIAVLALAGCVRVEANTSIGTDDTFSQHAVFAITDAVAAQVGREAGVNVSDLTESLVESDAFKDLQATYPDQVTIADYEDGDLHGIELTITDLPLSEFNGAASEVTAGLGATASIEHVDDTYVVTMTAVDGEDGALPGGGSLLSSLDAMGVSAANLSVVASSIDFGVSYTFPGLVTEATSGTIDGNTATLALTDLTSGTDIRIVGGDSTQRDWWPLIKWLLIAAAFASVIGGATLLVRQDQRRQRTNSLPPPVVTEQVNQTSESDDGENPRQS
jgi:hypothetical protein